MAQINNKADLDTALSAWYGSRGDFAASADDDDFVALCEDRIHLDLRVRAMETSVDLVMRGADEIAASGVSDSGTAITLTNTTTKTVNTLGDAYIWTAETTTTGATDITIDSITAVNLFKGGSTELEANDLVAGQKYHAVFDGTDFQVCPPGSVPLPSRYLQHRRMYLDTMTIRKLTYYTPEEFYQKKGSIQEGTPRLFTVEGEFITFGPRSDTTRRARLLYYRGFARLSGATDTNWIFDNARGLYLYGALLEAAIFINDTVAMAKFSALYSEHLSRVMAADQRDRTPAAVTARSDIPTGGGI